MDSAEDAGKHFASLLQIEELKNQTEYFSGPFHVTSPVFYIPTSPIALFEGLKF